MKSYWIRKLQTWDVQIWSSEWCGGNQAENQSMRLFVQNSKNLWISSTNTKNGRIHLLKFENSRNRNYHLLDGIATLCHESLNPQVVIFLDRLSVGRYQNYVDRIHDCHSWRYWPPCCHTIMWIIQKSTNTHNQIGKDCTMAVCCIYAAVREGKLLCALYMMSDWSQNR